MSRPEAGHLRKNYSHADAPLFGATTPSVQSPPLTAKPPPTPPALLLIPSLQPSVRSHASLPFHQTGHRHTRARLNDLTVAYVRRMAVLVASNVLRKTSWTGLMVVFHRPVRSARTHGPDSGSLFSHTYPASLGCSHPFWKYGKRKSKTFLHSQ